MPPDGLSASLFLTQSAASRRAYLDAVQSASRQVADAFADLNRPTSGVTYRDLAALLRRVDVCPPCGQGLDTVLEEVRALVLRHLAVVSHPRYVAHLHSPALLSSLAAEVIISACNQSLDSFDQSPSATALELHVVGWLTELAGLGPQADGVFTSGATQSNLMGLLLARDHHALSTLGWCIAARGLPDIARSWRILCSEDAHFSVARSASVLGLGASAVVPVTTSLSGELVVPALEAAIDREKAAGRVPIAVVLTAGTTDIGAIDPLADAAAVAHRNGAWVHVDAAAAGALLLSDRHRHLLRGIEAADSLALDFHKLLYQAISCGVLLVDDSSALQVLRTPVPYLDPEAANDEAPNLVAKSLQTTRRFDALKVFVTLRALGRQHIAQLVDSTLESARHAATVVADSQHLRLLAPVATNIVLLRWEPRSHTLPDAVVDRVNQLLPAHLWRAGKAVLGRTCYRQRPVLKLTLLDPISGPQPVVDLVSLVERAGYKVASDLQARAEVPACS